MSPWVWVRLLPVAAFLAALLVTVSVSAGGAPSAPSSTGAADTRALAREQSPEPPRLVLADVRELPAPLATPEPRERQPTRPAAPVSRPAAPVSRTAAPAPAAVPRPAPVATVAPVAPEPSQPTSTPAPPPRPAVPQPTPAPTFDDSGSGPEFDDDGASP